MWGAKTDPWTEAAQGHVAPRGPAPLRTTSLATRAPTPKDVVNNNNNNANNKNSRGASGMPTIPECELCHLYPCPCPSQFVEQFV